MHFLKISWIGKSWYSVCKPRHRPLHPIKTQKRYLSSSTVKRSYSFLIAYLGIIFCFISQAAACVAPSNNFRVWANTLLQEMKEYGISETTLSQVRRRVAYNPQVVDLIQKQPEIRKQIWEYLDSAVSAKRIRQGREVLHKYPTLWENLEQRFGVSRAYLIAIWGLETNFGTFKGTFDVIEALSTQAFIGHRRSFVCRELLLTLYMIDWKLLPLEALQGSWAGAIGHTQFIPSALLRFGVDLDQDGLVNVWDNHEEALASTAFYLVRHGWKDDGLEWGSEVSIPENFDWKGVFETSRTASEWSSLGVRSPQGEELDYPPHTALDFLAPAGYQGPIFLVTDKFDTLLKYNYSIHYALAVGLLADQIVQRSARPTGWPREERALTYFERLALQRRLSAAGYSVGKIDGILGKNTRKAIRTFQKDQGLIPDGAVTLRLLVYLRSKAYKPLIRD